MLQEKKVFSCLDVPERTKKPRATGLTMLEGDIKLSVPGMNWIEDLVEWGGEYIDYFKVNRHLMFQPRSLVVNKLKYLKEHDIQAYLGGGATEVGARQGCVEALWQEAQELGIGVIEVSTTHLPWDLKDKVHMVKKAKAAGFTTFVEVGKKRIGAAGGPKQRMAASEVIREMNGCLAAGAFKVVYEYTEIVKLMEEENGLKHLLEIARDVGTDNVMFEVPVTHWREVSPYVALYVEHFGPNVNIGDVDPSHVAQIEVDRCRFWS
jgi:phosphosulfolactate synthase (CoM biosynthesis protein A)